MGLCQAFFDQVCHFSHVFHVQHVGEYIPTPKNAMVKDLYEQLGFARLENGRFQAEVSGFPYHKTFITEE